MKRSIILLLSLFVMSVVSMAQPPCDAPPPPPCRKQMQVDKVTFINEQVGFTDAEAKRFWALYDAYRKQLHDSRLIMMTVRKAVKSSMQDYQDANDILQSEAAKQEQYHKDFYNTLNTFLTPQKIDLYFEAEEG